MLVCSLWCQLADRCGQVEKVVHVLPARADGVVDLMSDVFEWGGAQVIGVVVVADVQRELECSHRTSLGMEGHDGLLVPTLLTEVEV